MALDIKGTPSWTCRVNLLRIHEDMIGRTYVYMKVCFTCNTFLCMKCDVTHSHTKSIVEGDEEDSDSGSDVGLPFQNPFSGT
jgi:hypothetical protein